MVNLGGVLLGLSGLFGLVMLCFSAVFLLFCFLCCQGQALGSELPDKVYCRHVLVFVCRRGAVFLPVR